MVLYTALCIIDIANLHIFYRLHQTVPQSWMLLLILFACSASRFITRFNQDSERCEVLAADPPHFWPRLRVYVSCTPKLVLRVP